MNRRRRGGEPLAIDQGFCFGDGVGFEIFDKPNFGISDFVQRANYLRALQGELSRTISQLDEIQSSRVMIVTSFANRVRNRLSSPALLPPNTAPARS